MAEQVLGVYIFHRHGDRTSKSWNPVSLTPLGAQEVASSAEFFRNRHITTDADLRIAGIAEDEKAEALAVGTFGIVDAEALAAEHGHADAEDLAGAEMAVSDFGFAEEGVEGLHDLMILLVGR